MGQKRFGRIDGVAVYRGRLKFHDSRAVMTNTPTNTFFEQLFSLTNNRNADIAYSN